MLHLRRAVCGLLFVAAMPWFTAHAATRETMVLMAGEARWWPLTQNLASALAAPAGIALLPTQGEGCISTVADVLQQPQVDAAILPVDCIAYVEQQNLMAEAQRKLMYVARLDTLPILLVTRRSFPTITSLAGKRIATGHADSAGFAAGELLLGGLELPFTRVPRSGADAMAALKAGEADAVLVLGNLSDLSDLDAGEFQVLGLTHQQDASAHYLPAIVPAADLGQLAQADVETVSTAVVLAVKANAAAARLARNRDQFSRAFVAWAADNEFSQYLSSQVPGLARLKAAISAVEQLASAQGTSPQPLQQGDGP